MSEGISHDPVLVIEAAIAASGRPVPEDELARHLPEGTSLRDVLAALVDAYSGRGIVPTKTAGGWAFRTRPECSRLAVEAHGESHALGRAAIETVVAIAVFGPVTRSEIERLRGVSLSKGTMDALLAHGLIRPGPRRDGPGRPLTWIVTNGFLQLFDLEAVSAIPEWIEAREQGLTDLRRIVGPDELPEEPDEPDEEYSRHDDPIDDEEPA